MSYVSLRPKGFLQNTSSLDVRMVRSRRRRQTDGAPHLQDEAPGDGHGVVVTQVESLKQLAVNRKHHYHDDSNDKSNNRLAKGPQPTDDLFL